MAIPSTEDYLAMLPALAASASINDCYTEKCVLLAVQHARCHTPGHGVGTPEYDARTARLSQVWENLRQYAETHPVTVGSVLRDHYRYYRVLRVSRQGYHCVSVQENGEVYAPWTEVGSFSEHGYQSEGQRHVEDWRETIIPRDHVARTTYSRGDGGHAVIQIWPVELPGIPALRLRYSRVAA